jgi:G3E family GTPase
MKRKIPVTVLTGFLGAGKTTLLNRILTENHGQRIAVIENEFGEIGVDQDLVIRADEEIFEMNNGCICCTVRGDLIRILGNLMKRRDKFDRILIETTGMADPGPVAQTFFVDDDIRDDLSLDGIVTVVDAKHVLHHLDTSDEVKAQIAFADVILLNKTDLVTAAEADVVESRIHAMNGLARVRRVVMSRAPMADVLDLGGFDLERALALKPTFLEPEYPFEWAGAFEIDAAGAQLRLKEGPDPTMACLAIPWPSGESDSLGELAERVFRAFSSPAGELVPGMTVQADGLARTMRLESGGTKLFPIATGRPGRVAVFTEHLPEEFALQVTDAVGTALTAVAEVRFAAAHEHDDTVTSVGVEFDGAVDGERVNAWLSRLLQTQGADIFRMKGLLNVAGEDERYVFQGVHMLFDGQRGGPWGDRPRTNRLVFIGRNLDRESLRRDFLSCAVSPKAASVAMTGAV